MTLVYRSTVGRRLTVSEGDGNISELSGSAGISFVQSGIGAIAHPVQQQLRLFVNVHQFMTDAEIASCEARDGTDVSASVLKARNRVMTAGGILHFPTGSYVVDDTALQSLTMVTLSGDGAGTDVTPGPTRILLKTGTRTSLVSTATDGRSVHIRDLDLNGQSNATAGVSGFLIDGANYCTAERVFIKGFTGTAGTRGRGVRIHAPVSGSQGHFNKLDTCLIRQCGIGVEGTNVDATNFPHLNTLLNVAIDACDNDGVKINGSGTYGWLILGGQSASNGGDGYDFDGNSHIFIGPVPEANTGAGFRNQSGTPNCLIVPGHIMNGINTGGDFVNCTPGMTTSYLNTTTTANLGAGNNNNYDFGIKGNALVRLSGDAGGGSTITGFSALAANTRATIVNVSAFNITVDNESGGSTATNRIITPTGASIVLAANDSMEIIYDGTSARWRVINFTT